MKPPARSALCSAEATSIGDWEADTVAGKTGKACLVTLTDRYSRFLKIQKVAVKKSKLVIEAMVKMLDPLTKYTVTPDRGKEFTYHQKLSDQLNIEVYFPDPHAPWQRGTNENTNGLLRVISLFYISHNTYFVFIGNLYL